MILGIKDKEYYILFREYAPQGMPWTWRLALRFLIGKHREFAHVDIFRRVDETQTLQIMSSPWQISVEIIEVPIELLMGSFREGGATACVRMMSRTEKDNYKWRGFIQCTSVAKAILGLRGTTKVTPKNLYDLAIKNGGVVLWDKTIKIKEEK